MVTALISILILGILSTLAFWRPNTVLFMIVAGISMMLGLSIPDLISSTATTTSTDITLGLALVAYAFLCIAFAFKVMFWSDVVSDED